MTLFKKVLQFSVIILLIGSVLGCGKYSAKSGRAPGPEYYKSATELTAAIRRGEITSTRLLDIYLERIERYNGKINAVVAMDVEAARARAAAADQDLARGKVWGPLHGLPMTVKDVFEVAGMPATSGDPRLKNHVPKRNAVAVQRLIDAGAIVFGKTNTPKFGADFQTYNEIYGTTNNPWDLSRTPGGSSGGSAAALAMGFTSLELGSDLGGSLRLPPAYTGVYGHRPTFGIVPRYGHIPPSPGRVPLHIIPKLPLFVAGPLARSAEDLGLALEVLTTPGKSRQTGPRPDLSPSPQKKLAEYRVALWFADSTPGTGVDAEVLAAMRKAVEQLQAAGVHMEQAHPDLDLGQDRQLFIDFYENMMAGKLPGNDLLAGQKKQQARWAAFFKDYDVLLAPVSRVVAFPHDNARPKDARSITVNGRNERYMSNLSWNLMAVVSGLPATAVPVGLSESGLPVGVQIIGNRLADRTTIAFAGELSKLIGGFQAPPGYGD